MGFGMQRWIYQQTSRKPFQKIMKRGYDVNVFTTPKASHLEGRFRKLPDESRLRIVNGYKRLEQNSQKIILLRC